MGYALKQNQTARPLLFLMLDSADHLTPKTGLSPTVTLSKNGGSFAAPAGAVSEVGSGWYKVAANATDANTLGPLLLHATATGADVCDERYEVVAYDPADAAGLGLSRLDVAVGTRLATAGYTPPPSVAALALETTVQAVKARTDNLPPAPAAVGDIPTATQNATAVLNTDLGAGRTVAYYLKGGFNRTVRTATTLTVYDTDDTTALATAALTANGDLLPIASVDP